MKTAVIFLFVFYSATAFAQHTGSQKIFAKTYNSGFAIAHDTYNAISVASDGKVYYVLSSQSIDTGGQMYSFDPASGTIRHCGDLTEACGEKGRKTISQGKSHVRFVESRGKLYFATHVGYYSMVNGMEKMGIPPAGYKAYPGGHILTYDLKTQKFDDLAIAPHHEGILTMSMDTARRMIYCITWPTGYFLSYNIEKKEMKEIGRLSGEGENGIGKDFRTLCRSLAIDATDGSVYATTSEGSIMRLKPDEDSMRPIEENMRKDYFGMYDPSSAGNMGYNWRQTVWCPGDSAVYGVHGNSGYLFRFEPRSGVLSVLDRITSEPSKRSGMFDQFSYGYLGFILGPDEHTLYYLTGGPIYRGGKRVTGKSTTAMGEAKGLEDLHLVTYDISEEKYIDHGAVFYANGDRPLYVNSIAVGKDGTVYTLARITENGRVRTDLVSIPKIK